MTTKQLKELMSQGFKKCASVTYGGKPFFLFNPKTKTWVVWNRITKAWETQN